MNFNIPTYYTATYVLPRKRIENQVYLKTSVPVEISEYDINEADLVHEVGQFAADGSTLDTDYLQGVFNTPFQLIDGKAPQVRSLNGLYYLQMCTVNDFEIRVQQSNRSNPFNGLYNNGVRAGLSFSQEEKCSDFGNIIDHLSHHEIEARSTASQISETQEAILQRSNELIIVDGSIYEQIREPVLIVVKSPKFVHLVVDEVGQDDRHILYRSNTYSPSICIRFGLDEIKKATETAERIASRNDIPFINTVVLTSVSDWAVQFRGEAESLKYHAKTFVYEASAFLEFFDHSFGQSWHDLSVAHGNHHTVTSDLVEAARRVCSMASSVKFEANPSRNFHTASWEKDFPSAEALSDAISRWDNRSDISVEWLHNSMSVEPIIDSKVEGLRVWEMVSLFDQYDIEKALGSTIDDFVSCVEQGAHVVAVEEFGIVSGLALVRIGDNDEPTIKWKTRFNTPVKADHERLLQRFIDEAIEIKHVNNMTMSY